jgi:hypothetical protein
MSKQQVVVIVVCVGLVAGGLWARHHYSPGQVVQRELSQTVSAFEHEETSFVISKIARDYWDLWGGTRTRIAGYVTSAAETYDDLHVDHEVLSTLAGFDEVRVEVRFVLSGTVDGERASILGTSIDPCRALLLWRKLPAGWQLAATEELEIPEFQNELDRRSGR